MSETDVYQTHGAFSWNELMSNDVEGSKKFYAALFNWTYEDAEMPNGNRYTTVHAGDHKAAGLFPTPEEAKGAPTHWGAYVTVDEVEASVDKAVSLGAKTITPIIEVSGVGRFCMIQDPQGAMISLITYEK